MSQLESPIGTIDVEHASRGGWWSWTKMADYENAQPPVMVGGDGPYLIESNGTRLLDAMSGLFTTQIGYSHGKELGAAAAAQMEQLAFYPNWAATNPATLALTERILGLVEQDMSRVFFTSGGSESVESAWKLARQHFQAKGEPSRRIVISRHGSYHGCTLGALSITGIPAARAPFEPLLPDVRHVASTDTLRLAEGEPRGLDFADAIERQIIADGAENVCMVILEPVQNAGGCLVPPPGYAQRVREICDRHGVLLCCDEVICGFSRLGHWFGSQRYGFAPDMITFAKGVTSGYAPLGGVIFTERVAEPLVAAEGLYAHGYTFGGHPVSCATALANLDVMERLDLNANVLEVEPYLEASLNEVAAGSSIAVDARGAGFFRALEVQDKSLVDPVRNATRANGVIVRSDVRVNPCLAISPPLISTKDHVDELCEALGKGLAAVAGA